MLTSGTFWMGVGAGVLGVYVYRMAAARRAAQ